MSARDPLDWLMDWYLSHCDDDWEHRSGVTIESLDNPGWRISIDLTGTALAGKPFAPVSFNTDRAGARFDIRWHHCAVENGCFRGAGGALDLGLLIGIFRDWAEPAGAVTPT